MAGRYEYHQIYLEPLGGKSRYLVMKPDDPVQHAIDNNKPFKMKKDHQYYRMCKDVWQNGGKIEVHITVNNPEAETFKSEIKYRIYTNEDTVFGKPVEKDVVPAREKDRRLEAQLAYEDTLPADERPPFKPVDPKGPPPGWL